jgi:hypothetical protein
MGFQFVVMYIDSFTDDVTYVRNVDLCTQSMIRIEVSEIPEILANIAKV